MTDLIDNIVNLSTCCSETSQSFTEAFSKIKDGAAIVKIPKQPCTAVMYNRTADNCCCLANFMTNFRTINDEPLGHLETTQGIVPIPKIWPVNVMIYKKYGLPFREGHTDLFVDAYLLNEDLSTLLASVSDLPHYPSNF